MQQDEMNKVCILVRSLHILKVPVTNFSVGQEADGE